jgi:predicted PurR-regulated permease PerM
LEAVIDLQGTLAPPDHRGEHERRWEHAKNVVVTVIGGIAIFGLLCFVASQIINVLLIALMAAVLAYVAGPAVFWLHQRGVPRALALLLIYLAVLGVLILATRLLIAQVLPELRALPAAFDRIVANIRELEARIGQPGVVTTSVTDFVSSHISSVAGAGGIALVRDAADGVVNLVVTVVVSLYLVASADRIPAMLERVVPPRHTHHAVFLRHHLSRVIGGYIRGQLTMALIIAVTTGAVLLALSVRFAVPIAMAAFILALIPVVGTLVTGVIAVTAASLDGVGTAVAVLVFYVVLHVIESEVLGPRITGEAVGVHPALSILVLLAAGKLFGVWGVALGVPVTGLAIVIGAELYKNWRKQQEGLLQPLADVQLTS